MYTKEPDEELQQLYNLPFWNILDPDGDEIASVLGEEAADGMLSHLNRKSY